MKVTGYKYTTELDAINARETCDAYYGIPVSPDDVTQNWVNYQTADLDTPVFWYIKADDSLKPVLGEPTEFDVTQPSPFPPFE
jgi:hypothetical protein